ncbi:hypothetical protein CGCVW01_v003104, partial [Colletotrichum viniferum]
AASRLTPFAREQLPTSRYCSRPRSRERCNVTSLPDAAFAAWPRKTGMTLESGGGRLLADRRQAEVVESTYVWAKKCLSPSPMSCVTRSPFSAALRHDVRLSHGDAIPFLSRCL